MSTVIDGSASVTINSGAVLGITSGTAVASTSGTSIDFTGIPSWVKRLTVLFNGVSTNGTSAYLVQIGAGSIDSASYVSTGTGMDTTVGTSTSTAGYVIRSASASNSVSGSMIIQTLGSNIWTSSHFGSQSSTASIVGGGIKTLSGTLDRVRITTVNGTDTFDAGSINILYE